MQNKVVNLFWQKVVISLIPFPLLRLSTMLFLFHPLFLSLSSVPLFPSLCKEETKRQLFKKNYLKLCWSLLKTCSCFKHTNTPTHARIACPYSSHWAPRLNFSELFISDQNPRHRLTRKTVWHVRIFPVGGSLSRGLSHPHTSPPHHPTDSIYSTHSSFPSLSLSLVEKSKYVKGVRPEQNWISNRLKIECKFFFTCRAKYVNRISGGPAKIRSAILSALSPPCGTRCLQWAV